MNRGEEPQSRKDGEALCTNEGIVNAKSPHIELPIDELVFRHLKTKQDIEEILYLRNELDLPERVRNDGDFHSLEKKGMQKASWVRSSGEARPLEPYGCCR